VTAGKDRHSNNEEENMKYNDYPFDECAKAAKELAEQGYTVHQKFTCNKCNARQTIGTPNVFFTTGHCEECGHITDIVKRGCNYLLIASMRKVPNGG
jgi:hypothetical protein